MNFIADLLSVVVSTVLSTIIFSVILDALNKSVLKLFVPLQNSINNVKEKGLLKVVIFVIGILICVTIKDFLKLNYIGLGILMGFFSSLTDIMFSTRMKKNHNS
ncbi:hypothetical protein [Clostridium estertheticum]|uniref:Uncharacterized protein n=1 Tax=Clostridium estertheticum TaxID=238834 RepID=A0A5N7ILK3_9CLOT|nr:hypothetical protein [Clostridium estertheticum]MBU3171936.1 hypothetical protein [Clostridium estertheticum]MCB2340184.1 hypothetical protein [Clostridium estertheticum]MPQ31152.1 hypothetical protein [Clostridium estertheticum]MPQ61827.1 hypothetical protein [Clostridium estertheticum]